MKKKISLKNLNVSSFTTSIENNEIKGGATEYRSCWGCTGPTYCAVCEGTEEATICCPPIK